ncbi:hypothetical protein SAMN05661080_05086 [Modestobacter sp. DSM 44400]|uniref:hypothetical protein n=1 Tax=Modestobacter sp. DSM 44400 TaxID=1550230 RepID=UPI00089C5CBD|nr:hypothetical protein [Modestobacter sp. DSM 44400]SDY93893.1 hypothetical protein SAMN05661080_05086 [Modestobacter sp. DSM 44400]
MPIQPHAAHRIEHPGTTTIFDDRDLTPSTGAQPTLRSTTRATQLTGTCLA